MSNRVLQRLLTADEKDIRKEIGATLKMYRKRNGLTQGELAKRAGITQSAICKIEKGVIQDPGVIMMTKIGCALGLHLNPWWLE